MLRACFERVHRLGLAATCLWFGCSRAPIPTTAPDASVDAIPDAYFRPHDGPAAPTSVTVTVDDLQAGWFVTTSRFVDHDAPGEQTITSDGTPVTFVGTATDVFVATITDNAGALHEVHAMNAACTMSSAHQLHVPANFSTIQAAINAAQPGDTVKVAPGTYTEWISLRPGVCLLGSGARQTVLDAQGQGGTLIDLTNAPGSAVAGFTIRGTRLASACSQFVDQGCAGVYLGNRGTLGWDNPTINAPPLIANNIFTDNDFAVWLYFHGIPIIRNNVFVGNRNGLYTSYYQDRALVANNVFVDNVSAITNSAAYLDVIDNVIVGSQYATVFQYIQTGHIACNVFWGNTANVFDEGPSNGARFTIGTDGNVEVDPHFAGNNDYHLAPDSPCKDTGCHKNDVVEPDGTPPDIGAFGGPLAAWAEL